MKITEPKTPYAQRYEPSLEDEEELRTLDAGDLMVDELDKAKSESAGGGARASTRGRQPRESDIPGLDIGEPEEQGGFGGEAGRGGEDRIMIDGGESEIIGGGAMKRSGSLKGEKTVQVDESAGQGHEGDVRHRDFEEMRKRHYEMSGVKGMLG